MVLNISDRYEGWGDILSDENVNNALDDLFGEVIQEPAETTSDNIISFATLKNKQSVDKALEREDELVFKNGFSYIEGVGEVFCFYKLLEEFVTISNLNQEKLNTVVDHLSLKDIAPIEGYNYKEGGLSTPVYMAVDYGELRYNLHCITNNEPTREENSIEQDNNIVSIFSFNKSTALKSLCKKGFDDLPGYGVVFSLDDVLDRYGLPLEQGYIDYFEENLEELGVNSIKNAYAEGENYRSTVYRLDDMGFVEHLVAQYDNTNSLAS